MESTLKRSFPIPFFTFLLPFLLLLTPISSSSSSPESSSNSSILQVVFTPKNSSYVSILESSANNLRVLSNSPYKPIYIITPIHESQIQTTIYCAKKNGNQIRVRSGGHDHEGLSYFSSETPFFTIIDLRNLNSISIDKKNCIAKIQTGSILGELYYKISQESNTLAFAAGVSPPVGVGGQFSGGGYGMISRKFGVAADHIIDAKIIDFEGRILDRKSMGEDLFWAIRGGGGANFGIITEWIVKLHTVPEIVTVFNVSRKVEQNATKLLHKWQYISDKIDSNLLLRIFIRTVMSQNKKTIEVSFTTLFLGEINDLLTLMEQRFPELGLRKEDCQEMSWIQSILYFAEFPIDDKPEVLLNRSNTIYNTNKPFYKAKSDFVKNPISEKGLEGIWKILMEEDVGETELQFSPYGGRFSEISESEIPFPHRGGNIFMIEYVVIWNNSDDGSRHVNWIRKLHNYMTKYVSKSPRASYVNYRDLDLGVNDKKVASYREAKVWGEKYFKNNFDRLVHVKTKVDPTNFFRNEQSIPPLVMYSKYVKQIFYKAKCIDTFISFYYFLDENI